MISPQYKLWLMIVGAMGVIGFVWHRHALRKLTRFNGQIQGMLLTVSHEARTPLTSIQMALSLLSNDNVGSVTPRQKLLLETASQDCDRLNRMIENLLNVSRLEAGCAQLQLISTSPKKIVAMAVDPLRPSFAQKNISLEILVPDPIENVEADAGSIHSALTNLLTNAIKFTPTDGSVRVHVEPIDQFIRFSVTNSGPAIPAEFHDRIFEKFFRVPQAEGPTGAGLGLAIAREIIEAHRGNLWIESPSTGGAVFSFTLSIRS